MSYYRTETSGKLEKFSGIAGGFIGELMKRPEVAFAFTSFRADYPQYEMEVDAEKAEQLSVNVKDLLQTMGAYFGSSHGR